MIQNSIKSILLLILLSIISISCHKEDFDLELNSTIWRLLEFKDQNESTFMKANNDYFLEFKNFSTLGIFLDVNFCSRSYEIVSPGSIEIGSTQFCTYICCDSDFAKKWSNLLPLMTRYYGKGDKLILQGQGEMVFIRDNRN